MLLNTLGSGSLMMSERVFSLLLILATAEVREANTKSNYLGCADRDGQRKIIRNPQAGPLQYFFSHGEWLGVSLHQPWKRLQQHKMLPRAVISTAAECKHGHYLSPLPWLSFPKSEWCSSHSSALVRRHRLIIVQANKLTIDLFRVPSQRE
jgi:hypothetical protein